MSFFDYRNGSLHADAVPLSAIAERYGTPCYVYSAAAMRAAYKSYEAALSGHKAQIHFAVKANSNLAVLNLFAKLGAGFDIVSRGELARVLAAGGDAKKIIFSGVGKSSSEMHAALEAGIGCFNVESAPELERLQEVAKGLGKTAAIAFRVNPDVDPKTHPYISTGLKQNKFGVAFTEALSLYRKAATLPNIRIVGVAFHIGSQLLDGAPLLEATDKLLAFLNTLNSEGIQLEHIDLGGGLGIAYTDDDHAPAVADYLAPVLKRLAGRAEHLSVEPGRSLVGNAGVLLTRVEYLKHTEDKHFAIVDAAMNDLARPALYDAWHDVLTVSQDKAPPEIYDIVGPVCESGDFLARGRTLALAGDDLLAIRSTGAYGMVMSSNYNSRPRAAEVMVDGGKHFLIRDRESVASLFAGEHLLP